MSNDAFISVVSGACICGFFLFVAWAIARMPTKVDRDEPPELTKLPLSFFDEQKPAVPSYGEAEIVFSASGHIVQKVQLLKRGLVAKDLTAMLESGEASTTIQKGGEVEITESGEVIAVVLSVDNCLEYSNFDVYVDKKGPHG